MSATLETYLKRLDEIPKAGESAGRAGAVARTQAVLKGMHAQIKQRLDAGVSATKIAKTLAPRGERPSWETVRRAIAQEFGIPKTARTNKRRRKAAAKAGANAESKADTKPTRSAHAHADVAASSRQSETRPEAPASGVHQGFEEDPQ